MATKRKPNAKAKAAKPKAKRPRAASPRSAKPKATEETAPPLSAPTPATADKQRIISGEPSAEGDEGRGTRGRFTAGNRWAWQPGQPSPHPEGRPKKKTLSEAYRAMLEEPVAGDYSGKTAAEIIAQKALVLAMQGDGRMIAELRKATEGSRLYADINEAEHPKLTDDELLEVIYARRGVLNFSKYTFAGYRADPVHELIASTLDQVVAGTIAKLMIFAPPQHGKSELVSVRLPAYWLGKRPDDPVILASYAASLAEKHSGEARAVVESEAYDRLFPKTSTRHDSRAVDYWRIAGQRGSMLAAGVGGPIVGHGARLGIIDDPFENWKQAQSLTIRDKVWEWWRGVFRTRIWEDGAIVLVMTRWHEDDLAGRLLSEQGAEWTVLRLPAIAETQEERDQRNKKMGLPLGQADPLNRAPGEPLAPTRFSAEALAGLKRDVGSLVWAGQYQGAPTLPEGTRFKRGWFRIVSAAPAEARRVRYWDKAGTQDGGKFTAGVLMARSPEGRFYVEDVVRGQWSAGQREKIIKQTAALDAAKYGEAGVRIYHEQEPGSGGKESAENTTSQLAGYVVRADAVTGDKDTRMEPFLAQCEAGNVDLVSGAWVSAYLDELCAIPNGAYRDQADGSSGAFNKLRAGGTGINV